MKVSSCIPRGHLSIVMMSLMTSPTYPIAQSALLHVLHIYQFLPYQTSATNNTKHNITTTQCNHYTMQPLHNVTTTQCNRQCTQQAPSSTGLCLADHFVHPTRETHFDCHLHPSPLQREHFTILALTKLHHLTRSMKQWLA